MLATSCAHGMSTRENKVKCAWPLLDLPRRIMRDIHCGIAACASQRRHIDACKGLTACDAFVLAGTARNDVRAALHVWLGLIDITRIKRREDLVAVVAGQPARAVDIVLFA